MEFSENPIESLLQDLISKDDSVAADTGLGSSEEGPSFWHFQKLHTHEYEQYLRPVTEADRVNTQMRRSPPAMSKEITKEGMTVAKGFDKLPPAESDAILRVKLNRPVSRGCLQLTRADEGNS